MTIEGKENRKKSDWKPQAAEFTEILSELLLIDERLVFVT